MKKISIEKIELHEEDAQFVRDLELQYLCNFEWAYIPHLMGPRPRRRSIRELQQHLNRTKNCKVREGRIYRLNLAFYFISLLPTTINHVLYERSNFHHSKEAIISSLRGDSLVKCNIINLDDINLSADPVDDLPSWYLNIIPESIGVLSELRSLNVSQNYLTHLPESMKGLKYLRKLDLSQNLFKDLPDWLGDLPRLKSLNLRNNPLKTVPKCVIALAEKNYTHFHKDVPHKEAVILGILDILSGHIFFKIDDTFYPFEHAHCYKTNAEGHITKIYLIEEDPVFEIFPEQLCGLEYLEEIYIEPNFITSLPKSLSKLKNLKILSMTNAGDYDDECYIPDLDIPEHLIPFLKMLEQFSWERGVIKKHGLL